MHFPTQPLPSPRTWALVFLYLAVCGHSSLIKWHRLANTTASSSSWMVYCVLVLVIYRSAYTATGGELTTGTFLVIYLLVTFLYRSLNLVCLGGSRDYPSSDNAAHLGGALCGIMLAFCWQKLPDDSGVVGLPAVVWWCTVYLILRCYFNF